jgi:hypothetical protein
VVVYLPLSGFSKLYSGVQTQGSKADLRAWIEEGFGNIGRKKHVLLEKLRVLEDLEEERGLYEEITRKATQALGSMKNEKE